MIISSPQLNHPSLARSASAQAAQASSTATLPRFGGAQVSKCFHQMVTYDDFPRENSPAQSTAQALTTLLKNLRDANLSRPASGADSFKRSGSFQGSKGQEALGEARRDLLIAVLQHDAKRLTAIMEQYGNLPGFEDAKQNALLLAAKKGKLTAMIDLCEWGANVNAQDHLGRTPLYVAIQDRFPPKSIQVLLNLGAVRL